MNADNPAAPNGQGAFAPTGAGQVQQAVDYQAAQAAHNAAQLRAAQQGVAVGQAPTQPPAPQRPVSQPAQAPVQAPASVAQGTAWPQQQAAAAPSVPQPASEQQATSAQAPVRASLRTGVQAVATGAPMGTSTTSSTTPTASSDDQAAGGAKGAFARFNPFSKKDDDDSTATVSARRAAGGPRRVRAMVTTVDPWSIIKLAFLLSIAAGIVFVVAVGIVWTVLDKMGVFISINDEIAKFFGGESETALLQFFARSKIMSAAILVAVLNAVITTALAAIGSMLYNLVVKLVGGVYVTLSDE